MAGTQALETCWLAFRLFFARRAAATRLRRVSALCLCVSVADRTWVRSVDDATSLCVFSSFVAIQRF